MHLPLLMDDQFLILAVILATKSFQCRKRFLELGGPPPICEWLTVAKRDGKVPLQKEVLRVRPPPVDSRSLTHSTHRSWSVYRSRWSYCALRPRAKWLSH